MSIVYFPEIYEDELVYSVLARYYVRNGYLAYVFCAEDIFADKRARTEIEFINALRPEALKLLCKDRTMEELIVKHTMFPYYARFLPCERRNRTFRALCGMEGDYNNLLAIPKQKNGEKKYLRYCPLCVEADSTAYGETFPLSPLKYRGISGYWVPFRSCAFIRSPVRRMPEGGGTLYPGNDN